MSRLFTLTSLSPRIVWALGGISVMLGLLVVVLCPAQSQRHSAAVRTPSAQSPARGHPPWIYGRTDARFTLIEFADLECPYCRQYFPFLQQWVAQHPDVNWQWHHLPLPTHEPAATRAARLAECAGEVDGNRAFWSAVGWIYEHTRAEGVGLPSDAPLPGMSAAIHNCVDSARPDVVIRQQVATAARDQIAATPTLRLVDHLTGKTLTLQGPVEGDGLLSAIDWLVALPGDSAHPAE